MKIQEIDTHGAIKGSYMNGVYDSLPEPGRYLVSTIDARLQLLGEELMRGKVGAAVAIEPSTGEILMMVSSPTYDPDELVGRERGNNYMKMIYNKRHPLFSRAVKAKYPPGSTFKLVQGLIGCRRACSGPRTCTSATKAGRPPAHEMPCPRFAADLRRRGDLVQRLFLLCLPRHSRQPQIREREDGYDVWKSM
ncbi:MAG: penicillin-binding transpeptidase domain-containing protein [Alistipes finegoldii]